MELQIEPVHQAQGAELVFGQLAGETAVRLGAELRYALRNELTVELIIAVHDQTPCRASKCPPLPSACLPRSVRTVGPSGPMLSLIYDANAWPSRAAAS